MYYNCFLPEHGAMCLFSGLGYLPRRDYEKLGGYEASGRYWIWPADEGTELRAATRRLYYMWHPLSCIEYEKTLGNEE